MALIALTSLTGSPGVTTTAVAWATISRNPALLIEADMVGGSSILAGRVRAQLPHERSLLALTTYDLDTPATEILREQSLPLPGALHEATRVVPGIAEAGQATALATTWPDLGRSLHDLSEQGLDVLVDLGRLHPTTPSWAMLEQMDQVLILAKADLPGLITLRNNLPGIANRLTRPALATVLRAAPPESFGIGEAAKVLHPVPVIAHLEHDPKGAATYSLGWAQASRRRLRSYHRQIQALVDASLEHRTAHHLMLTGAST